VVPANFRAADQVGPQGVVGRRSESGQPILIAPNPVVVSSIRALGIVTAQVEFPFLAGLE
jgi:hypothetical protein